MLPLKNNEATFGWPAIVMHWIMAIGIIFMLCLGLWMVSLPNGLDKLKLFGLHKSLGVLIFFFVAFRYLWRQINFQPCVPRENQRGWIYPEWMYKCMNFFAHYWHVAIYFMIFLLPISGWLMSTAYGFPVSVFGWFTLPSIIPANKENAELLKTIHDWTAYVLIFFIIVHTFASLFHHFILKDIVMKRMLPIIAILLLSSPALAAQKFEVDKAKSSIKFEAVQNGAPTVGEFKSYTAQIEFDPKDLAGSKAVVDIDMVSVSSTYEEMVSTLKGAEWFDTSKFPKAKFEVVKFVYSGADKHPVYEAQGNLTIRNVTKPAVLNFSLTQYDAKNAAIDGTVVIKRTDFGIGWKDTAAVKDDVKVTLHIEAASK